jgi:indoleamine 2,3-dioxygenase
MSVQSSTLAPFGINPDTGFLPARDPLTRLPAHFQAWDDLGAQLPALLLASQARAAIARMPELEIERLEGEAERERALLLLSTFVSAYVWGVPKPAERIPRPLAVPLCRLAEQMGRKPIIHHAANVLNNWRRLDSARPIRLDNLALLQGFLTSSDEAWFILVTVEVEKAGASAPTELLRAQEAIERNNIAALAKSLERLTAIIGRMEAALRRMYEQCDPYIFYHRVRPFFASWNPPGVIYEGVSERPQMYAGGSAGQSALVQSLDAALSVRHESAASRPFIHEMRAYMPPAHRRFVETLERGPDLRAYVIAHETNAPQLLDRYNACIGALDQFRYLHLKIAVEYISQQAPPGAEGKGTGGTDLRAFLGAVKKETRARRLPSERTP